MTKDNQKLKEIHKINVRRNYFTQINLMSSAQQRGATLYIVAPQAEALLSLPTWLLRAPVLLFDQHITLGLRASSAIELLLAQPMILIDVR